MFFPPVISSLGTSPTKTRPLGTFVREKRENSFPPNRTGNSLEEKTVPSTSVQVAKKSRERRTVEKRPRKEDEGKKERN